MVHMLIGHPYNNENTWFKDVLDFKMREFIESRLGDSQIEMFFKWVLTRMVTHDYESRISSEELNFEILDFLSSWEMN